MKALHAVLVALATAVTITSVAAAGPKTAKQRVMFTTQAAKTTPVSPEVFTPLAAGALKPDSGTLTASSLGTERTVMRDGQEVSVNAGPATFKGKRGTLVISYRSEWVDAGNGYHIATETWKVVRGTGQYAGVTGGGRGGSVWNASNDHWSSHDEGFLTLP